jgi:hypothetical protein
MNLTSLNNENFSCCSDEKNDFHYFLDELRPIFWTFFLPSVCLFGSMTNFLSILVFVSLKCKEKLYQLFLISSVNNLLYLTLCGFVFLFKCQHLCSFSGSFFSGIYEIYVYFYLTSAMALFNSFIEILISLERYLIISKCTLRAKKSARFQATFKILLGVLFLVSLGFYVPIIVSKSILRNPSSKPLVVVMSEENQNASHRLEHFRHPHHHPNYIVQLNEFGRSSLSKSLVVAVSFLRGPAFLTVITLINILNFIKLKTFLNGKCLLLRLPGGKLCCSNKSNKKKIAFKEILLIRIFILKMLLKLELQIRLNLNLTKMTIAMSVVCVIGNLPNSASFVLTQLIDSNRSIFYMGFVIFSNTVLFLYHGLNLFIYRYFNKQFKSSLNKIINCY